MFKLKKQKVKFQKEMQDKYILFENVRIFYNLQFKMQGIMLQFKMKAMKKRGILKQNIIIIKYLNINSEIIEN